MIYIDKLKSASDRYKNLEKHSLLVRAVMKPGASVCDYEAIHLDSLLAKAVILSELHSPTLPDVDDAYWLPIPVEILWSNEDGVPLWAASTMQYFGESVGTAIHMHKRNAQMTFANSAKVETRKGRWMERRQPIPVRVFGDHSGVEARVIGNADAIYQLLSNWKMIGKHRSRGFGEVDRWEVLPAEFDNVWERDGKLIKPMPMMSKLVRCLERPVRIGWTPPQWKPSLMDYGWRVGTRII